MNKIERSIYMYRLFLTLYKDGKVTVKNPNLQEEINKILKYSLSLKEIERKINYKVQNKILYLDSFTRGTIGDEKSKNDVLNICFTSAKYNQVREVIDTSTLKSKGNLKKKNDGDKENNHISIAFEDKSNARCAFEANYYGIGFTKLVSYLNDMADKYYKSKGEVKFYRIDSEFIPNDDFLANLSKMKKITIARFYVYKTDLNVSDFSSLAERNDIRDEVAVVVKSERGESIGASLLKKYYSEKNKEGKIVRITADGEGTDGSIYLDTEKMKTRYTIHVDADVITGVVISKSIYDEFNSTFQNLFYGVDNA